MITENKLFFLNNATRALGPDDAQRFRAQYARVLSQETWLRTVDPEDGRAGARLVELLPDVRPMLLQDGRGAGARVALLEGPRQQDGRAPRG